MKKQDLLDKLYRMQEQKRRKSWTTAHHFRNAAKLVAMTPEAKLAYAETAGYLEAVEDLIEQLT